MLTKRILIVVFVLFLAIIFIMGGCTVPSSTPTTNTITATAGIGGQINPGGEVVITEGENQTFTITPYECYQIVDVLVDGTSEGPVTSYTFGDIQQNHTIQVSFVVLGQKVYNTDTGVSYQSIQAAIAAAGPGDTIIVCPGTYVENIVFDDKNITVRSTEPSDPAIVSATIIDGGGVGHVVLFEGGDKSALEGFTIRSGYSGNQGGGIFIYNSNPTITDNTITGNTAEGGGGGISVGLNSILLPYDFRPIGWGTGRENIPTGATLDPAQGEEYTIAGNEFLGNEHGMPLNYSEGAHVYFQ